MSFFSEGDSLNWSEYIDVIKFILKEISFNKHFSLNDFDKLYLSDNELIKIEETLHHKGKNIVKLSGVKDRNHAESYRDKEIYRSTKTDYYIL